MATFVNDLRLTELATGEASGSWGTTTNVNLELIGEAFSFGTEAITTNADTHTTTIADGATDPGRSMFLQYTGTLDSACTITIAPNTVSKLWFIENATSGSQSIIISQGSGANITIPNGQTKAIYSDGAGSGAAMVDAFQDLSIPDLFVDDDLTVGDDLILSSDSAIIKFGADADTTLTHTDGSGLTLNSTNKIMFNDASQFIQGSSATVLSLGATDEIDLTATAIDVNGTIDVSGNATLGGTLGVTGAVTADAGISIDNITIDGTEIDLSSGDLTIDVAGDIILDAGGAQLRFHDDGTDIGVISNESNNLVIKPQVSDADLIFKGNDGGSTITALTLDMSAADAATFNDKITAVGTSVFTNLDISGDVDIDGTTNLDVVDIDGAVDMASTLQVDGAITSSSGATISVTDNSDVLHLKSTDDDANVGPVLLLNRVSSSPADSDVIGSIDFDGRNDAGQAVEYAQIIAQILDASDGTEDGALYLQTIHAGTKRERVSLLDTETVLNNASVDLDFRIESDSNTHMLFVDAGNDRVMVGKSSTGLANQGVEFEDGQIKGTATGQTVAFLNRASDDGTILDVRKDNSVVGTLGSNSAGGVPTFDISSNSSSGIIRLLTSGSEAVRIDNSGLVGIGNSSPSSFNALADNLVVGTTSGSNGISIVAATDGNSSIYFADGTSGSGQQLPGFIQYGHSTNALLFGAATLEHLKLDGSIVINEGSNDIDVRIETDNNNSAFVIDASDDEIELNANTFSGGQFTLGSSSFFLNVTNGYRFNDQANSVNLCVIGNSGEMSVNEGSQDYDFRVESNSVTHALFVDAGNGTVNINTSSGAKEGSAGGIQMQIAQSGAAAAQIFFDGSSADRGYVIGSVTNDFIIFNETAAGTFKERLSISDSEVIFNQESQDINFRVESDSDTHCLFVDAGNNTVCFGSSSPQQAAKFFCTVGTSKPGYLTQNETTGTTNNIAQFMSNGESVIGTINATNTATAYNTSSDYRLKENIETLKDGLDRLNQLKPVRFTWTTDGSLSEGFIAHEVEDLFPDAVSGEKDAVDEEGNVDPQQVDYGRITPLLVKAIQEQQEQIEELKAAIAKLKGE